MNQAEVKDHFEKIANDYDGYKKQNWLYFWCLKRIAKKWSGLTVLDYGCGTGGVLLSLNPKLGVGYDTSRQMIKNARLKCGNKQVKFTHNWIEVRGKFDTILCMDVVEHLANPKVDFQRMVKKITKEGRLVVTFVGNEWEWILNVWESMKWKMPEGPHDRVNKRLIVALLEELNMKLEVQGSGWPVWPITVLVFKKI